jgi:ABC-type glycerol-3-phosphate transport system substrate-binding protein
MKSINSNKLRGFAIMGIALLFLLGGGSAFAEKQIRMITTETDPTSVKWMNRTVAEYEKTHPDLKIIVEFVPLSDMHSKLMTAVATDSIPEVIGSSNLITMELSRRGLIKPVKHIIDKIGRSDFLYPALVTYNGEDQLVPYGVAASVVWYRKDWFAEKGLSIPYTWPEMLKCAKALTEDVNGDGKIDRYGRATALGRNEATPEWTLIRIWANGGHIFNVWNEVVLDKTPYFSRNAEALDYIKELSQYSPPGSAEYAWYEEMHSFAVGKVAMADYAGRIMSVVEREHPEISEKMGAFPFPGPVTTSCIFIDGWAIPANCKYPNEAEKLIEYLVSPDVLVSWCHTVPGHIIPPRRSIMLSEKYVSHPMIKKHQEANRVLNEVALMGKSLTQEYPGIEIPFGGEVWTSLVFADLTQNVAIRNVPSDEAVKKAANRIRSLIEELKKK